MPQPVLIETTLNGSKLAASATALNNKFILTTSHLLLEQIQKSKNLKFLNKNNNLQRINEINLTLIDFNVIFPTNNESYLYKKAKLYAYFKCNDIHKNGSKYLNNWKTGGDGKESLDLLGLFFILKCDDDNFNHKKVCNDDYKELLRLLEEIYYKASRNLDYKIGDCVVVQSTPFGERSLINSHVQGIIANVFGDNNCLILTDCPTTMGSEGGLLHNKNCSTFPIGVVLSSLVWWNGEWLGLTLCVSILTLFNQFITQNKDILKIHNERVYLNKGIKYGLVQIVCGPNRGTGVLINKNQGIFLTSSHVIDSGCTIKLLWNKQKFEAEILYQPDDELSIFDLAVLKCKNNDLVKLKKTDMHEIQISTNKPNTGDRVIAAGFPIFAADLNTSPSVTAGNISKCYEGRIITSCSVFPGSSGGALLNLDGFLVGIIMSNLKSKQTKASFPRISLIVPVFGLKSILKKYYDKDLDINQLRTSLDLIKTRLDVKYRHSKL